jgi:uncharacterized protein (DUF427 family)
MKATWNNTTLAESDETIIVEKNHYFSPDSVKMEFLRKSGNQYTCPWKGVCDYYTITVDGKENPDAAWMYPEPKEEAKKITGYFAFWKGVEIAD